MPIFRCSRSLSPTCTSPPNGGLARISPLPPLLVSLPSGWGANLYPLPRSDTNPVPERILVLLFFAVPAAAARAAGAVIAAASTPPVRTVVACVAVAVRSYIEYITLQITRLFARSMLREPATPRMHILLRFGGCVRGYVRGRP